MTVCLLIQSICLEDKLEDIIIIMIVITMDGELLESRCWLTGRGEQRAESGDHSHVYLRRH